VAKDRKRSTECAIDRELLGRIRDVIVATHDVGDLHVDIVDDDGKVVQRRPIAA